VEVRGGKSERDVYVDLRDTKECLLLNLCFTNRLWV
jgi:hypothetical protein